MQNDYSKIAESLHPLERRVLPYVSSNTFSELSQLSGISEAEISRPMQWLQEKGLVSIKESALESATLGRNGIAYAQTALPEIRFLKFLATPKTLGEIKEKSGLTDEKGNDRFPAGPDLLKGKKRESRGNAGFSLGLAKANSLTQQRRAIPAG